MLKSLFESSIDKLNIPADMKTAIKQINKICLEAEGQDKDPEPSASSSSATNSIKAGNPKDLNETWKYNAYTETYPKQEAAPTQNATNNDKEKSIMKEDSDKRVAAKNANKDAKTEEKSAKDEKEKDTDKEETKSEETKEEQPAKNAEPDENKETQGTKDSTGESSQNTEAKPKAAPKYRADVATVQFFIRATEPQTNLVGDGILGPKTITAIQQTEDIKPTGKMDAKTKEAFNRLLAEAKQKVIPIQKQLGVTADGLIGKQTLAAMQKANMNVTSVFNENPTAQQTQVANNQGGNNANDAAKQGNTNVLAYKFNEAEAQKLLNSKNISQKEYNIWKTFGIAPVYQRSNPQETQTQIAQIRNKQQEANAKANTQPAQNQAAKPTPKVGTKQNPNIEVLSGNVSYMNLPADEKKVFDDTESKFLASYNGKYGQHDLNKADMAARTAVLRYRKSKGRPMNG